MNGTLSQMKRELAYWKKALDLSNWTIVLKIKRKTDMSRDDAQGYVEYIEVSRNAVISILDPQDWDFPDFQQDILKTLIHELLHLKFALLEHGAKTKDTMQHQLIDDLAKSMVKIYRRAR